jgi:hypothetical protein
MNKKIIFGLIAIASITSLVVILNSEKSIDKF